MTEDELRAEFERAIEGEPHRLFVKRIKYGPEAGKYHGDAQQLAWELFQAGYELGRKEREKCGANSKGDLV